MLGIDANIECEGRDRTNTTLPGMQEELALRLLALGKPTVVVFLNGGKLPRYHWHLGCILLKMPAISLRTGIVSTDRLAASKAAIVEGWYPGISGSAALAKSLFGKSNKWGKLPNTVRRCFLDSPRTFASR